jgi:hypothetical protein
MLNLHLPGTVNYQSTGIEFITGENHNFLADFAEKFRVPLKDNRVTLPATM